MESDAELMTVGQRRGISRSLGLMAELFTLGFTPEVRGLLGDLVPAVGVGATPGADPSERAGASGQSSGSEADPARASARHEELFGYLVPPFEGVFLDPEGQIGGSRETVLIELWACTGHRWDASGQPVEHVGACCRLTASLLTDPSRDAQTQGLLRGHLLGWLPALVHAWRRNGFEDYAEAGDLLVELLVMASALVEPARKGVGPEGSSAASAPAAPAPASASAASASAPAPASAPAVLPPGENAGWPERSALPPEKPTIPTDNPQAGIRDLADHLAHHARAGFYSGRGLVMRLGRGSGTPRGFGGTALMMGNLLRTAAHLGSLDQVLDGLEAEAASYLDIWKALGDRHAPLLTWAGHWEARIIATQGMLSDIRMGLASLDGE